MAVLLMWLLVLVAVASISAILGSFVTPLGVASELRLWGVRGFGVSTALVFLLVIVVAVGA